MRENCRHCQTQRRAGRRMVTEREERNPELMSWVEVVWLIRRTPAFVSDLPPVQEERDFLVNLDVYQDTLYEDSLVPRPHSSVSPLAVW